jgi:amino acid adenylation domain-containing protein
MTGEIEMTGGIELSEAKRQLLEKMMSGAGPGRTPEGASVVPRAPGMTAPISPDQLQLWLHAQMAPDVPIYNEPVTLHRRGSFDLTVMERSFNEILRRHEIWRTSFEIVDGEIMQIVHPDLRIRLTLDDLTSAPSREREREALRMATEDARRPIDLGDAPLFRARVVKLAEEEHRLYLTLHHMIFDGVSLSRVFVPELSAVYDAFSRGHGSPLAEPTLQYGDYAIRRRQDLASDRIERQMQYWRRTLSGALPKLELAGDHAPALVATHRGSMETFTLSLELTEALKALSQAECATLYMTLLAAFKAMLFRYTGQEDILVGGVTDLRRRPELEQLMGYFLNAMALRTRPSADLTFRDYLAQVRNSVFCALDASEAPFDRVVRELSVGREAGAHPIFQVVFSIQPLVDAFPEGWDLTQMDVVVGGAKFDLYLELEERPEGMSGRFIYSSDLFEADTIRRMIGHWQTILHGAVADPDRTLARLPLMTPSESRQILLEWNATGAAFPAGTLHQWFQTQAQRTPDSIALAFEGRSWTYRDLDHRSDVVAARLRRAGVEEEALVGICMNRSPEMVASLLGILKAGGAYLPLDPGFPPPRLAFIVDDAKPVALLTETELLAKLPVAHLPVILCDAEVDGSSSPGAVNADGDSLAYVLYTSGSTGQPKGVEVPHSALVNLLAAMQREVGFTADDSLLALTTLSFDLAAFELFLPLVSGGRVVIASRDVASDPLRLASLIGRSGCTVMAATPATWRGLIEAGWPGGEGLAILCGGEAMPRSLAEDLLKRGDALWNIYGPTETTILSTAQKVLPGAGPVPIGRPIANTQHYILDPSGNAVPVGVVGELCIGGAGVARGYRNRPDLTQDRFVERTIAAGARLYRTGDLARYRPDGAVEYLSRIDSEEKVRGFRLAVEEIEAALVRHPDIGSAAVRAWPDASGNKALTAYLVVRRQHEPTATELRRFLGETLPDFMIPSRFMRIQALPMTPNGKVDRKALPESSDGALRAMLAPPQGEAEEKLAEIWKGVLGVPEVGRNENFFDLGGHSLLVTKLLRRIELEYGRRLTMAVFFRVPTIEAMAKLLGEDASLDLPVTIAIQPNGSRPPLLWLDGGPTFRVLSHAIGLDQPFLGIPVDPVLELNAASAMRLEDIATLLAKAIRESQPEGPYYLGGWCHMGILAYEVASQLVGSGQAVDLVILLDAPNPASSRRVDRLSLILSQIRYHWPRLWRHRGGERRRYLAERIHGILSTFEFLQVPACDRPAELRAEFGRVVQDYKPPVYFGDVALFQPTLRLDVLDFRPDWAERVRGELSARDIPGTHVTMLEEPHVWELGASIRAALLRAQERNAEPLPRLRAGA